MVTDIGGLNDRGFNALAYKGLQQAKSDLGADIRVVTSKSNADYVPNLSSLARQKYDLVVAVGFLMGDATAKVAKSFPQTNFAIVDFPAGALKGKPTNVRGLLFKEAEAGYLVGYMAGLYAKEKGGDQAVTSVGGQKVPAVDAYIAGYQAGAKKANPEVKTRVRLLAGLRRPGEVQGDRAQPDRQRLAGRLRGRRPVRARRARRGQGEERPVHRRRRRPGLRQLERDDLGAQEGRRRGVRDRQGGPGRLVQGRRGRALRRQERRRRPRQGLRRPASRSRPTSRRSQDQIASGEITDIPTTVK